jgi:hypothetical protein
MGRRRWPVAVGAAVLATLMLSSCGGSTTTASQAVKDLVAGLPVRAHAQPLKSGLDSCTPDGGFYIDQTRISFYYMRLVPLADVLPLLSGQERRDAQSLAPFGKLLEVVALATNPGASTCGVGLTQTVLETAAEFGGTNHLDPSQHLTALQNTYYQPIRPILELASGRLSVCAADVNPGASVWLLAVFPPVRAAVPIAVVNPAPAFGFYLPLDRGALPASPPPTLYSEDVDQCLQILNAS